MLLLVQGCLLLTRLPAVEEDTVSDAAEDTAVEVVIPTDTADTADTTPADTADTAPEDTADTAVLPIDEDGDGHAVGADCDDTDSAVHPGAIEWTDGVDNNCDDDVDFLVLSGAPVLIEAESYLGWSMSIGDISGDGKADLITGSPLLNEGGSASGAVYIFDGPLTADRTEDDALAILVGEEAGEAAGESVAVLQDVNGDGHVDLLVGAPTNDRGENLAGAAYLILGPITADADLSTADNIVTGAEYNQRVGYDVADAGDVNGDGLSDLLLGTKNYPSFLLYGPVTGTVVLAEDAVSLEPAQGTYGSGTTMAGVGDLDGDGFGEFMVSLYYDGESGSVAGATWLVSGPLTGMVDLDEDAVKIRAASERDEAGTAVAGGVDTNGDGFSDFLIGAPGESTNGDEAGAAYLVLGPVTASMSLKEADATFLGLQSEDIAGDVVAMVPDGDGDGFGELLIGAPMTNADTALGYAGLALGPVSGVWSMDAMDRVFHGIGDSRAGSSVIGGEDLSGDGLPDFLITDVERATLYLLGGVEW